MQSRQVGAVHTAHSHSRQPVAAMTAVYYEGQGRFTVGTCNVIAPAAGEVRLDVTYCGICGTDLHIAHGHMDQRIVPPQVIGHEMSGRVAEVGAGVDDYEVGDPVVVRPLDTRVENPADRGFAHVGRDLKFIGIDAPGAFQASWTVPAITLHKLPPSVDLQLAALIEPLAVACHDVRRGQVGTGQTAVVIGGGPIGLLIALVARAAGAEPLVAEINPFRRELAARLGLEVVDPSAVDLISLVRTRTADVGADVVFEVSGSHAGAEAMTQLAAIRGTVVVVAIFPEAAPVRLFDFFWKELQMLGARVYEPEDYERAIELVAGGTLPLGELITSVEPLSNLPEIFSSLKTDPSSVKVLVDCRL